MKIQVDLNTRILGEGHNIFMARPGHGYKFYRDFLEASMIGPEFPGVKIRRGTKIRDHPDLDNQLKKSMEIRRWAAQGRPKNSVPSKNPEAHKKRRKSKGWPQFISILEGYFQYAKKGDLVVIPPSAFAAQAVLGEFSGNETDVEYLQVPMYGQFAMPVRRIVQLATIEKRKLPSELLDVIAKPTSFVSVGRSLHPFLYDLAYGSYVVAGDFNTKIEISSVSYNINDDLYLLAFLNFIAANTKIVTLDKSVDVLKIFEAAFVDLGEFAPALRTNINSPGALSLRSPYITPLVAAVMLALAAYVGAEAVKAAETGKIVIGNSKAPADDPCTAEIEKSVLTQIRLFGLDKWPEACEIARKVIEETGLKPSPTVERKN